MAAVAFSEWTDEALIAEYGSKRCDAAFAELHRRHNANLRRFLVWKFEFDDYVADEISQLTWIKIAELANRQIDRFRSWLFSFGSNIGKRWVVGQCSGIRKKERSGDKISILAADNRVLQPVDELIAKEEIAAVKAAMEKLDPTQQAILESVCVDGKSASEATGLPASATTAANRIVNNAKGALMRALSHDGGPPLAPRSSRRLLCVDEAARIASDCLSRIDNDTALARFGVSLDAFKKLDCRIQAVAALHFIDGESTMRIAMRLNVNEPTAWRWREKAKAALQLRDEPDSQSLAESIANESLSQIDGDDADAKFGVPLETVKRLDCRLQAVVALRFVDGLSSRQIARRLNIKAGTVNDRLREAKAAIPALETTAAKLAAEIKAKSPTLLAAESIASESFGRIDGEAAIERFGVPLETVKRLDCRLQAVVALRFIDRLTQREIASRLNIGQAVVGRQLKRFAAMQASEATAA